MSVSSSRAVGNTKLDFFDVKQAAESRWSEILPALTQLPASVLQRGRSDHPCPLCGGDTVIWPATDAIETGRIACRKCTDDKPTGDGIATVAKWAGLSQIEAAKAIAAHLGIEGQTSHVQRDLIEEICRDKRMPLEAFKQFGPRVAKYGRGRQDCVRIPTYNERGEAFSYFNLVPGGKGRCKDGKGNAGLFLPGRLPQPGETWLIVEGVKDAAALIGLGFNACGLPTNYMNDKYAMLFAGCDIILVPDLDTGGQSGSQMTGGRLFRIATSVRVARLPGEVVEKGGNDVRDVLARQDGERLVRQAIESAEPWQPREGEPNKADGRPEVLVTLAYGWICDQVTQCIGRLGWESSWIPTAKREALKVYQRGGSLVHVVVQDGEQQLQGVDIPDGTARIRPLPIGQIPLRIADACQLMMEKETAEGIETIAVPPQRWLVDGIATRGDWGGYVRRLTGVITAPTLRADGTILQAAGYDEGTGLLYVPGTTKFPKVPEKPSLSNAQEAASELLEVVKDFPFVDDADRSAWLTMVLSQIGRAAILGCVPLFAHTATCRGSGKSLLVDAASTIAYGRNAPRKTFSSNDDETRKAITAVAIEALPSVLLDNVDCQLGGSSLDAALTATSWTDRVLGSSRTTGELPLRTIWAATGNNLRFGSDLSRRVLPIRLAPTVESPEERSDFEQSDLRAWVAESRPRLAVAALTLLRAYFVAGRPAQPGGVWGSFEAWSALIRGAIVWAGLADPLATRETAKAEDTSVAVVRGLIGGLLEIDEAGRGLTVREIVAALNQHDNDARFPAMRDVVAEVATSRGLIVAKSLTYVFRRYKGRVANGWKITGESARGGVTRWRCVPVDGDHGDHGDHSLAAVLCKSGVSHTCTDATHVHAYGNGEKPSSPSSPWSPCDKLPSVTCKCGATLIPAADEIGGWRNWDCPKCGEVQPRKEATIA